MIIHVWMDTQTDEVFTQEYSLAMTTAEAIEAFDQQYCEGIWTYAWSLKCTFTGGQSGVFERMNILPVYIEAKKEFFTDFELVKWQDRSNGVDGVLNPKVPAYPAAAE